MTMPAQHDPPTTLYPLNPCGHLRGPGLSCIGLPECKREPVSPDKMGELVQRAGELRDRLLSHPAQALTRDQLPEARAVVTDKLGSAVTLAECLDAVLLSLIDDRALLTPEQLATLATVGANVTMRVRDLRAFLATWLRVHP
jgi:hypothetical protein